MARSRFYRPRRQRNAPLYTRLLLPIKRKFKCINSSLRGASETKIAIAQFAIATADRINCACVAVRGKALTLLSRHVLLAVRLALPTELSRHAMAEGTRALQRFAEREPRRRCVPRGNGVRVSAMPRRRRWSTGIAPSILMPLIRNRHKRVAKTAFVFFAAALEYLVTELIDVACKIALSGKRRTRTVSNRHVLLAVRSDNDLNQLCRSMSFFEGGNVECVHEALRRKATRRATRPRRREDAPASQPGVRRAYRFRPGVARLRLIRSLQKSTAPILKRSVFTRLSREILDGFRSNSRIAKPAVEVLQHAAEAHLVQVLQTSQLLALHAKRTSVQPRDFHLARKLLEKDI